MSYQKNDGGPAFPGINKAEINNEGTFSMSGDDGMSLRDYFIAHAPAEPQPWFTPIMDIKRPQPHFDSSRSGNCLNRMALDSWDNEYDKQRHLQWPVAWADAMLAARGE